VDREAIRALLEDLRAGRVDVDTAVGKLRDLPFEDLGFAKVDHHRALRGGAPEAVFCPGKTPAQVVAIVQNTYLPSIEAQIRAINALGVPPGEQAEITKLLDLAQADLNKLKRNPALVGTDVFGDFARVAHPYGLTACAPTS